MIGCLSDRWGQIIRFFLRDVDPSRLWGADPVADMIEFCRSTNRWCTFELTKTRPPTTFPPDTFDMIYAFSVFSRLSERMHEDWLIELGNGTTGETPRFPKALS
jgi:hypothetical protein